MGASQPFLYDLPSKYSFTNPSEKGFNPRAATEASWSPAPPREKVDGPLIESKDFNRHPDSYFVVPYGNLNWKPMSPRTKDKVKWSRYLQLFLRICSLLGAGGFLFAVICIKNTDATTGWIIRVPAGIAIVHCVYGIYHLSRSSRGRTPSSSASYMLFAAILDVALIPFYVFSALMARAEYTEPAGTPNRWGTLFNDDAISFKIFYATFLISAVCGGLHLGSLILDIYLGVLFKQIARLPPDQNPLESNLTRRHKRNKSSLVDNRMSQATTATANSTSIRDSKADDPLISPVRSVPFMHTRNESQTKISGISHPNFSPRASRSDVSAPFYDQPASRRSSRTNASPIYGRSPRQMPSNSTSHTHFPNLMLQNQSPTIPNLIPLQPSSSPRQTTQQKQQQPINRSPTKSSSIYSTETNTMTNTTTRPRSTVPSLPDSNWITHPSPTQSPSPSPPRELMYLGKNTSYQPLSQTSPFEHGANSENNPPTSANPLEMNPPTPPIEQWRQRKEANVSRALTPGNGNARQQASWNQGPGMVGIGKARAWGGMGQQSGRTGREGRVISRSGVEVREGGIFPTGGVRAREVSGKVMEEGRGSSNWDVVS